ncbi:MAG: tryptophan 7-halogenase [Planctomycetes bacterium]|nr:tryptophan 7-halogenase [Planctomycetota bacterium]
MNNTYDVIVIGGGPSGSTASTILADYGYSVLQLERTKFPRHHIGESLIPHTYWTLKRIGMLEQMKSSNFVVKESVQFINSTGRESAPFFFPDRDPGEWSYTWQVHRDKFDQMLLDNARKHGVNVVEQATVREVIFEDHRAVGVRVMVGGETKEIRAKVTVDATGQSAMLSRQLNTRYGDEKLKNAVIYSYWKNALRDDGRNAGATLVIALPNTQGWFWFIPLEDNITSIGVVAPPAHLYNGRGDDPGAILEEEIANTPGLARRLVNAERVRPYYTTADFSYRSRRAAGDGWVLVGDAFGFLDPLYSSGVLLALKSAELAADCIHDAFQAQDFSEERLGRYGPKAAEGMHRIRMLVYAYYDPTFRMGKFVSQYPHLKNDVTRVLIGDVFEDDLGELFDTLAKHLTLPESIMLEHGQPA